MVLSREPLPLEANVLMLRAAETQIGELGGVAFL